MQLRVGLFGVALGVLLIAGGAVVGATTDLNGSAGILIGSILILLYGGQASWAIYKRRRGENS